MSYARQMLDTYQHQSRIDAGLLAAAIDALKRLRPGLQRRHRRRPERAQPPGARQVHPAVPPLCRYLRSYSRRCQPPCGIRWERHQAAAGSLRRDLQELWRRVRAPLPDACALSDLRRGVPALRASLP